VPSWSQTRRAGTARRSGGPTYRLSDGVSHPTSSRRRRGSRAGKTAAATHSTPGPRPAPGRHAIGDGGAENAGIRPVGRAPPADPTVRLADGAPHPTSSRRRRGSRAGKTAAATHSTPGPRPPPGRHAIGDGVAENAGMRPVGQAPPADSAIRRTVSTTALPIQSHPREGGDPGLERQFRPTVHHRTTACAGIW